MHRNRLDVESEKSDEIDSFSSTHYKEKHTNDNKSWFKLHFIKTTLLASVIIYTLVSFVNDQLSHTKSNTSQIHCKYVKSNL